MFFNKPRSVGRIYIQAKTPYVLQEVLKKLGWKEREILGLKYNDVSEEACVFWKDNLDDIDLTKLFEIVKSMQFMNAYDGFIIADYTYYVEATWEPSTTVIYYFGFQVYNRHYDSSDRRNEIHKSMPINEPVQWINFIECCTGIKETTVLEGLGLTGLKYAFHKSDIDEMRKSIKKIPSLVPFILTCIGVFNTGSKIGFICLCLALFLSIYFKKKRMYKITPIIGIIFSSVMLGIFVLVTGINWLIKLVLI